MCRPLIAFPHQRLKSQRHKGRAGLGKYRYLFARDRFPNKGCDISVSALAAVEKTVAFFSFDRRFKPMFYTRFVLKLDASAT